MTNNNPKLRKNGGKGTAIGNFLRKIGKSGILKTASNIVGKATGMPFLNAVNNLIQTDDTITQKQKEEALKHYQLDLEAQAKNDAQITERHKNDMLSDSWLSKNIRPLSLIASWTLVFVIFVSWLLGYNELPDSYLSIITKTHILINLFYFGDRTIRGGIGTYKK